MSNRSEDENLGKRQKSKAKFHFASLMEQLETLWLEVELNDKIFTIERSMQVITGAMKVREGMYFSGTDAALSELISVEDISLFFLQALNIPIVSVKKADGDPDPLSFPLLMRGFILHQEDSYGAILDKVQPEQRKADIIGFLSRITPEGRYGLEDKLGEAQRNTQELQEYFGNVADFLKENDVPTLIEAEARMRNAEESLNTAQRQQKQLQRNIGNAAQTGVQQPGRLDVLRESLLATKERIAQSQHNLTGLRSEEERLQDILASLESDRKKAQRLQTSSTILSSVEFSACPRCLLEISEEMHQREQYARCSLCNRPLRTTSDSLPRRIPRVDDIDSQITEAQQVLDDVRSELQDAHQVLEQLRQDEQIAAQQLDQELEAFVAPAVDRLLAQAHAISQREADLAQARYLYKQALALDEVRERLQMAQRQQAQLEDELREQKKANRERLSLLDQYYDRVLRAVEFPDYQSSSINSKSLMPDINGSMYIHTGTAFKGLATLAYHLALFDLSRQEDTFFPRMLVIDSPGVGDLNDTSHDQLLRYIASLQHGKESTDASDMDWQIILTTRRMIDELRPYVREELSAPDQMLLRSR